MFSKLSRSYAITPVTRAEAGARTGDDMGGDAEFRHLYRLSIAAEYSRAVGQSTSSPAKDDQQSVIVHITSSKPENEPQPVILYDRFGHLMYI